MSKMVLPATPEGILGSVKAWSAPVVIPTYLPAAPDKNPMFLEKRVYQGSSGRVYPLPIVDRISENKTDETWQAVHIENEYVRLMILPQLGGRIHVGLDKTNNYDFFYRQNVIKPALVGLAGPWVSGGVEFNWPQHHRPSTYMPAEVEIERHEDGSVTVWCSEHEPMNRMKGMHGVCLHPCSSLVELKARLYNRTPLMQTFLWWANVAVRVHELYQSFFPPDVSYVADHARRAMSRFPHCEGLYYGVDYGAREKNGVPSRDLPRDFLPPGTYPANDLSWYANIPVPTSYMAMGTRADFMGGYDHHAQAGLVHVANRHIAPGKKQWTWGNHEFGYAWDRNLTDEDGPYIELMAGVYTDNQPDFSFLHPGETRTWSQYWYPIQKIGPVQAANTQAALSVTVQNERVRVGLATTSERHAAKIEIACGGNVIESVMADIKPNMPFVKEFALKHGAKETDVHVSVTHQGTVLVTCQAMEKQAVEVPEAAREPELPADVQTNEQLYLIGLHLEQYRHATRPPEIYWREGIRRDPMDSRCHKALGVWHLRRGELETATIHLREAIRSQTRYNPNPAHGEAFYYLGIALRYMSRDEQAYDALYKSTWNYAWQSPAFFALAQLDCRRQEWEKALEHLDRAMRVNADHSQARVLKIMALRKLNRNLESRDLLRQTLLLDPLDTTSRWLAMETPPADGRTALDIAFEFAHAGFWNEAIAVLDAPPESPHSGAAPLIAYGKAYFFDHLNDPASAKQARAAAINASPDYCFPAHLDEIPILQTAIAANPADARARLYLANLLYDRRRHEEAVTLWEQSARLDPSNSITWRNLGIGYFNILHNAQRALNAYDHALRANPGDARLIYERDQLWKRIGETPERRLAELERHPTLVSQRDDLSIELCTLYNQTGQPEKALTVLRSRRFQPWEGGEGLALGQHVRTHLLLAKKAAGAGNFKAARHLFAPALEIPQSLGEAKHLLMNQSDVHYHLALACQSLGDDESARRHFQTAAEARGHFQQMSVQNFSEMTFYSALALRALDRNADANTLLAQLLHHARRLEKMPAKIDYFATSLPTLILFDDDLQKRQAIHARFMQAQAHLGLRNGGEAETLLAAILAEDPNHGPAKDLLAAMQDLDAPARKHAPIT